MAIFLVNTSTVPIDAWLHRFVMYSLILSTRGDDLEFWSVSLEEVYSVKMFSDLVSEPLLPVSTLYWIN